MESDCSNPACKICGTRTLQFAQAAVLDKHLVQYYLCSHCGFVQTETPYWLDEAYSAAMTASDIGLAERSVHTAAIARAVIRAFFSQTGTFLDYGGGYGLFVRLMRDTGFDFYRFDRYAPNLFAAGFDLEDPSSRKFDLLTAFEVFEHFVEPYAEIERMFTMAPNILFSTRLVAVPPQPLNEWWYYGCEHGQHVALFSRGSLAKIAADFGVNFVTDGRGLHLFTPKNIPASVFRLLSIYRLAQLWDLVMPQRSLRADDYRRVTGREMS